MRDLWQVLGDDVLDIILTRWGLSLRDRLCLAMANKAHADRAFDGAHGARAVFRPWLDLAPPDAQFIGRMETKAQVPGAGSTTVHLVHRQALIVAWRAVRMAALARHFHRFARACATQSELKMQRTRASLEAHVVQTHEDACSFACRWHGSSFDGARPCDSAAYVEGTRAYLNECKARSRTEKSFVLAANVGAWRAAHLLADAVSALGMDSSSRRAPWVVNGATHCTLSRTGYVKARLKSDLAARTFDNTERQPKRVSAAIIGTRERADRDRILPVEASTVAESGCLVSDVVKVCVDPDRERGYSALYGARRVTFGITSRQALPQPHELSVQLQDAIARLVCALVDSPAVCLAAFGAPQKLERSAHVLHANYGEQTEPPQHTLSIVVGESTGMRGEAPRNRAGRFISFCVSAARKRGASSSVLCIIASKLLASRLKIPHGRSPHYARLRDCVAHTAALLCFTPRLTDVASQRDSPFGAMGADTVADLCELQDDLITAAQARDETARSNVLSIGGTDMCYCPFASVSIGEVSLDLCAAWFIATMHDSINRVQLAVLLGDADMTRRRYWQTLLPPMERNAPDPNRALIGALLFYLHAHARLAPCTMQGAVMADKIALDTLALLARVMPDRMSYYQDGGNWIMIFMLIDGCGFKDAQHHGIRQRLAIARERVATFAQHASLNMIRFVSDPCRLRALLCGSATGFFADGEPHTPNVESLPRMLPVAAALAELRASRCEASDRLAPQADAILRLALAHIDLLAGDEDPNP